MLRLYADFETVLSPTLGEVIRHLKRLADLIRGQEGVAPQSRQAANSDGGKTAILSELWNPFDPKLVRNAVYAAFRTEAGRVQVVKPYVNHVNSRGSKDVGVADDRLTGLRGLKTLLEPSAICDTTEDAGDQLRIIDVAESTEYLIALGRIHVNPGVDSVLVLKQIGACRIVS